MSPPIGGHGFRRIWHGWSVSLSGLKCAFSAIRRSNRAKYLLADGLDTRRRAGLFPPRGADFSFNTPYFQTTTTAQEKQEKGKMELISKRGSVARNGRKQVERILVSRGSSLAGDILYILSPFPARQGEAASYRSDHPFPPHRSTCMASEKISMILVQNKLLHSNFYTFRDIWIASRSSYSWSRNKEAVNVQKI